MLSLTSSFEYIVKLGLQEYLLIKTLYVKIQVYNSLEYFDLLQNCKNAKTDILITYRSEIQCYQQFDAVEYLAYVLLVDRKYLGSGYALYVLVSVNNVLAFFFVFSLLHNCFVKEFYLFFINNYI